MTLDVTTEQWDPDSPWWQDAHVHDKLVPLGYYLLMATRTEELFSCQLEVDINHKYNYGETSLLQSLRMGHSDDFIMNLIEKGVNVNIPNDIGETPLHLAILRPSTCIAEQLIRRGANINAQDREGKTPLHDAVETKNSEAVSMLLYYGADVNLVDDDNVTPFVYSITELEIAQTLFPFYDTFSDVTACGCTAVLLAAYHRSPIAISLVQAGADVNYVSHHNLHLISFSICYESAELFKLVWKKFDYKTFLDYEEPFLCQYVRLCNFSASEYVECLYLILQSSFALDLMRDCMDFIGSCGLQQYGLFHDLLLGFKNKKIKQKDRIAIINLCFALGADVNICDINLVHNIYGFNQELEAFIYNMTSFERACRFNGHLNLALPTFILAVESECSTQVIVDLLTNYIRYLHKFNILNSIGYFFLPYNLKWKLYDNLEKHWDNSYEYHHIIDSKLSAIPKVPSLLELSRNQARKFVKGSIPIQTPYHFHDAVKRLDVPQRIKDVIRFKIPVYM